MVLDEIWTKWTVFGPIRLALIPQIESKWTVFGLIRLALTPQIESKYIVFGPNVRPDVNESLF